MSGFGISSVTATLSASEVEIGHVVIKDDTTANVATVTAAGALKVDVSAVTPGTGPLNLGKAEDAIHVSGDVGVMLLAVRNDAATPLAGDGDYIPLQVNAGNELRVIDSVARTFLALINTRQTDGSQVTQVSDVIPGTGSINLGKPYTGQVVVDGDVGVLALTMRTDGISDINAGVGEYSLLAVTKKGHAYVNLRSEASGQEISKADNATRVVGDFGFQALGVRNDFGTTLIAADNSYGPQALDLRGGAHIVGNIDHDKVDIGNPVKIGGKATTGTPANVATGDRVDAHFDLKGRLGHFLCLQDGAEVVKLEDAVHASGDPGIMALFVRKDAQGTLSGTDGDYTTAQIDAVGNLRVVNSAVAAFDHGSKSSIGTSAVALIVASTPAKIGVLVKAARRNSDIVYIGNSDVTAGTADATDGLELFAGESVFIEIDNVNKLFAIAGATGQKVFFTVV